MFRELLSNKVVLAGILFCFLMVSGSLLYSWHVNRGIQEEDDRSHGISPYGFGPYPKVPPDFPEQDIWDDISTRSMSPNHELIARVQIKLWNQGIHALGAVFNSRYRLIYPIIDNVVYIKWADAVGADGKPYVQRWLTSPDVEDRYFDEILTGTLPPHVTVHEFPDGGIDPYEFLELPK